MKRILFNNISRLHDKGIYYKISQGAHYALCFSVGHLRSQITISFFTHHNNEIIMFPIQIISLIIKQKNKHTMICVDIYLMDSLQ